MSTSTIAPSATEPENLPAAETEQSASDAVASDTRIERIRQAAYGRYEQRGFENGHEEEDWLAAEAEVGGAPELPPDQMP